MAIPTTGSTLVLVMLMRMVAMVTSQSPPSGEKQLPAGLLLQRSAKTKTPETPSQTTTHGDMFDPAAHLRDISAEIRRLQAIEKGLLKQQAEMKKLQIHISNDPHTPPLHVLGIQDHIVQQQDLSYASLVVQPDASVNEIHTSAKSNVNKDANVPRNIAGREDPRIVAPDSIPNTNNFHTTSKPQPRTTITLSANTEHITTSDPLTTGVRHTATETPTTHSNPTIVAQPAIKQQTDTKLNLIAKLRSKTMPADDKIHKIKTGDQQSRKNIVSTKGVNNDRKESMNVPRSSVLSGNDMRLLRITNTTSGPGNVGSNQQLEQQREAPTSTELSSVAVPLSPEQILSTGLSSNEKRLLGLGSDKTMGLPSGKLQKSKPLKQGKQGPAVRSSHGDIESYGGAGTPRETTNVPTDMFSRSIGLFGLGGNFNLGAGFRNPLRSTLSEKRQAHTDQQYAPALMQSDRIGARDASPSPSTALSGIDMQFRGIDGTDSQLGRGPIGNTRHLEQGQQTGQIPQSPTSANPTDGIRTLVADPLILRELPPVNDRGHGGLLDIGHGYFGRKRPLNKSQTAHLERLPQSGSSTLPRQGANTPDSLFASGIPSDMSFLGLGSLGNLGFGFDNIGTRSSSPRVDMARTFGDAPGLMSRSGPLGTFGSQGLPSNTAIMSALMSEGMGLPGLFGMGEQSPHANRRTVSRGNSGRSNSLMSEVHTGLGGRGLRPNTRFAEISASHRSSVRSPSLMTDLQTGLGGSAIGPGTRSAERAGSQISIGRSSGLMTDLQTGLGGRGFGLGTRSAETETLVNALLRRALTGNARNRQTPNSNGLLSLLVNTGMNEEELFNTRRGTGTTGTTSMLSNIMRSPNNLVGSIGTEELLERLLMQ